MYTHTHTHKGYQCILLKIRIIKRKVQENKSKADFQLVFNVPLEQEDWI